MASTQIEVGNEGMCNAGAKPENFPGELSNTTAVVPAENLSKAVGSNDSADMVLDESDRVSKKEKKTNDIKQDYQAGDLVWCQIKTDPWWPAQVRDACFGRDRLLVACFGNNSGSWCMPSSHLKPFVPNFNEEMSKAERTADFIKAVNEAVDKVSRALDSHMICNCISAERREQTTRPIVTNEGIRSGVPAPEVDVTRLQLPQYGPAQVLSNLLSFARRASFDSALEVGVVKGWLSAFYRSKGIDQLQAYQEPCPIEGLEASSVVVCSPQTEIHERGSDESEDATKQLVAVDVSTPRVRKKSKYLSHPYTDFGLTVRTSGFKRGSDESNGARKQLVVVDVSTPRIRKKSKYLSPPYTDLALTVRTPGFKRGSDELNGSSKQLVPVDVSTPRIRKKSTYLSPPHTDLALTVRTSGFKRGSDESNDASKQLVAVDVSTPRIRKKNKYLSPPYTGLELVISTKGEREERPSGDVPGPDGEDDEMNLKLALVKSKGNARNIADREDADSVSAMKAIREMLDHTSKILDKYHGKFTDKDKASLGREMKNLKDKVEDVGAKVNAAAGKIHFKHG